MRNVSIFFENVFDSVYVCLYPILQTEALCSQLSVFLYISSLFICYQTCECDNFENESAIFDVNWYKWFTGIGMKQ